MDVAYEARQVSLNRKVALTVLNADQGLMPKAIQHIQADAVESGLTISRLPFSV
jgi:hypothetical protein